MAKAKVLWNGKRYQMVVGKKTVTYSKNLEYFNRLVAEQKHPKILKFKVTEYEVITTEPKGGIAITDAAGKPIADIEPTFNIDERFELLEELINMVVEGDAKSLVISGEGGVGKSYAVLSYLKNAGKVDVNDVMPNIEDLNIAVEDNEEEIKGKVLAQINQPKGDYIRVKGYATAKALYRLLYENRDRTIIFDDCDKVLQDGTAISLLKSALDSYEERWVSWFKDQQFGESDLPMTFKFKGKVIFISNMRLSQVDEAIRTRCFKVDLSMTKPQRIERMRTVLAQVMPDAEMEEKADALDLLEKNMHVTDDVNFRSLMNLITIRRSGSRNWKRLGVYSLTEKA